MADMNRRNVLLGLGTAAAGSGIVFGSGAFTQLEADRDVTIGVEGDDAGQVSLTEGTVNTNFFTEGDVAEFSLQTDLNNEAEVVIGELGNSSFDDIGTENGVAESAFEIGVDNDGNEVDRDLELTIDLEDVTDHSVFLHLEDPDEGTIFDGDENTELIEDNNDATADIDNGEDVTIEAALAIDTDDTGSDTIDSEITLTLEDTNPTT